MNVREYANRARQFFRPRRELVFVDTLPDMWPCDTLLTNSGTYVMTSTGDLKEVK